MIIGEIRALVSRGAVSVDTTTTEVVRRYSDRFEALVQNGDASVNLYLGSEAGLAAGNRITLAPGAVYRHLGSGALFARAASGSVSAVVFEAVGPSNTNHVRRESTVSVAATAKVLPRDRRRVHCTLQNRGSDPLWLGDDSVTTSNGIKLAPGASAEFWGGHALWATTGTATNEVQSITLSGSPTGGTFTLTYDGQTTAGIAYNASASTVQSALRALSSIGASNVNVSGSGPWTVTFAGALAGTDVAQMTANGSGLTGGTAPSVAIATTTGGDSGASELWIVEEACH